MDWPYQKCTIRSKSFEVEFLNNVSMDNQIFSKTGIVENDGIVKFILSLLN